MTEEQRKACRDAWTELSELYTKYQLFTILDEEIEMELDDIQYRLWYLGQHGEPAPKYHLNNGPVEPDNDSENLL